MSVKQTLCILKTGVVLNSVSDPTCFLFTACAAHALNGRQKGFFTAGVSHVLRHLVCFVDGVDFRAHLGARVLNCLH